MGVVYRAHDEQLERDVALKVLPAGTAADDTSRVRLLREARMASRLNHPHICTIFEVGEWCGQAYIAMELVEGRTLNARLCEGPLGINEAVRIGRQVADALAHAHQRGVVHRDLKSANIMLTSEARVKVLDFGLAKQVVGEASETITLTQESLTTPGTVVGTLAYMPPEQLCGQAVDARSDIWALGVVLYEMVAGRPPFQGRTGFELSAAILSQAPAAMPGIVPGEQRQLIERCLAKEPGQRFQTAAELCAALEALQPGTTPARRSSRQPPARPRERKSSRKRIRAVAVLPLTNLSRDPEQEFFADGMTEALIACLAKIGALRVISRTSAMRYKASGKSLPQIAQELNVDGVVEGSVLRAGNRVRITAQLIHAATDTHLWAESYERDLQDVLVLQCELARTIAGEIKAAVTPEEATRLARATAVNPEAYEACLKGRFHWYRLSAEHLSTAFSYFQLALEKDPDYAPAHAGIAAAWMARTDTGSIPPQDAYPKAKAAAARAIALDESLTEAHVTMGNALFSHEWNWPGAEAEFQRAIQLNPNDAAARFFYCDFLISMRRVEEWRNEIGRSLQLDPLNFFYQCFYGWHLVYLHRCDEAILQLRKALLMEPGFTSSHLGIWGAFYQKGLDLEALEQATQFFALLRDGEACQALERGFAQGGYARAMSAAADTLAARSLQTHVPAFRVARLYSQAGEVDRAIQWLEKAYEQRESPLVHLSVGWDWDSLRADTRFQSLLRRMNLPE
jgi:serine/threonine-protein kinase